MAKTTVTIKFEPCKRTIAEPVAQICSTYEPNNAAADLEVFKGTYYDTNVNGWGVATTLHEFIESQVAYPKLGVYLREAVREKQYQFSVENDEAFVLYLKECAPALKAQGFEFTFV